MLWVPRVVDMFQTRERRQDQRVSVEGRATLRPEGGHGLEVFGRIVDVAPLGVRIRILPPGYLHLGAAVSVDLHVKDPGAPPSVLPVRLKGRGVVVRWEDLESGGVEIALSLESPLEVREAFAMAAG